MRLIARYAKEKESHFEVLTVYDDHTDREEISKENPSVVSLTKRYSSALWFERKMYEDFGIVITDAFDSRPLAHQERFPEGIFPMQKAFRQKTLEYTDFKAYKFEAIDGDGVFQVSVGPIHAGIIEPGHFHFSQAGEDMLHLEIRHFYKYRAIEKMLEGKTLTEAKPIIERISGTESIAYQIALRDIMLQASRCELSPALEKRHALLLELERLAHHCTDLGAIPNDGGFGAALAFSSKLTEDIRRKLKELTGSRFGFSAIDFEIESLEKESFLLWLDTLEKELTFFQDWIMDIPSLWDRLDTTGKLTVRKCLKYGVVGVMAKAAGVGRDRRDTAFYAAHGFEMAKEKTGDVAARFKIRLKEAKNSIVMIRNFFDSQADSITLKTVQDGAYESFCESAIGEVYMAIDMKEGVIERFFVRDPSFVNWQVVHTLMPDNIIADFPLINKSCDLSYAGNDL